jgi:hypothetical protein
MRCSARFIRQRSSGGANISLDRPVLRLLRPDRFNGHSPGTFENEMMRRGLAFALSLSLVAGGALAAAPKKRAPAPRPAQKAQAVRQLVESCDAHKFETMVTVVADGQPHQSKVKLCGVEGQSDADWIKTLKDAISKLDANQEMAPAVREQIVTAINSEIARLTITGSIAPRTSKSAEAGSNATLLSRDYSSLPPLPGPLPEPRPAPLPQPRAAPAAPIQRDFAELPPIPPPPAPGAPSAVPAPRLIPLVAPRVTFGCDTPGELTSDAPCAAFERETMLTIHAGEDVPQGTLLQFVRNDQPAADIPLGGLRRGKALRLPLPASVCSGFASGKLELRIAHGDAGGIIEPLKSDGPYSLRC